MRTNIQISIVLILLCFAPSSLASINYKEGAYISKWIDLQIADFSIQRIYHSRSLYKGIFGIGWCSTLDYKVEIIDSIPQVYDCEKDQYIFLPKNLKILNNTWQLSLGSIVRSFNLKGELIKIQNDNTTINLERDLNGKLNQLSIRKLKPSSPIRFNYPIKYLARSKQIEVIGKIKYSYRNNQLIGFKNQWGSNFSLKYDSFENLVSIKGPQKYQEVIKYDNEIDVVTSWNDNKGCLHLVIWESQKTIDDTFSELSARPSNTCFSEMPNLSEVEINKMEKNL